MTDHLVTHNDDNDHSGDDDGNGDELVDGICHVVTS